MDRRLTADMFPGGIDERVLRRGDLCDRKVIESVLGLFEGFDDEEDILKNPDAYTKRYIGNQQLLHTFYRREDGQGYRYAGMCPPGEQGNMHPEASQKVFIISQCHANDGEGIMFNLRFAEMIARNVFLKTGDIPIAPHIYFTAFLNDVGFERDFGIEAGHLFMRQCDRAVCAVIDGRISEGMRSDIDYATTELALEVEYLRFTKMQAMDYIEAMESEMKRYGAEAEHR